MGLQAEAEIRGPERFFYDKSTYPTSYSICQESKTANPVPRGDCSFAGEVMDLGAKKERSYSGSPAKGTRTQARVCVMCNHCWRAERSERRSDVVRCPECLSDQPGDDYFNSQELEAMAEQCAQMDLKHEEERRCKMAAASHARSAMRKKGYTSYLGDSE
jgi:hypothetical protein